MRQQTPISFLMVDVDNLYTYNETYGHLQGDIVLKEIAQIIKQNLYRSIDVVARWDGEQFAVILPDTVQPGACIVAEKIRSAIEKHLFLAGEDDEKSPTHVTVSIGTHSSVPRPYDEYSAKNFIADVVRALDRAKAGGRNRVSTVGDE